MDTDRRYKRRRSNERDESAQALFEAQALWKKKTESGCHADITHIDHAGHIEPMLAKKWEDRKDRVSYRSTVNQNLMACEQSLLQTEHSHEMAKNGKPFLIS